MAAARHLNGDPAATPPPAASQPAADESFNPQDRDDARLAQVVAGNRRPDWAGDPVGNPLVWLNALTGTGEGALTKTRTTPAGATKTVLSRQTVVAVAGALAATADWNGRDGKVPGRVRTGHEALATLTGVSDTRRVLAHLVDLGWLVQLKAPSSGRNAIYLLARPAAMPLPAVQLALADDGPCGSRPTRQDPTCGSGPTGEEESCGSGPTGQTDACGSGPDLADGVWVPTPPRVGPDPHIPPPTPGTVVDPREDPHPPPAGPLQAPLTRILSVVAPLEDDDHGCASPPHSPADLATDLLVWAADRIGADPTVVDLEPQLTDPQWRHDLAGSVAVLGLEAVKADLAARLARAARPAGYLRTVLTDRVIDRAATVAATRARAASRAAQEEPDAGLVAAEQAAQQTFDTASEDQRDRWRAVVAATVSPVVAARQKLLDAEVVTVLARNPALLSDHTS